MYVRGVRKTPDFLQERHVPASVAVVIVCASYRDGCNAAVAMATDARHQRRRWGQRPNAQDRTY